jgi:FlaA1/EpsC-like NDP-sugar epimerase
MNKKVVVFGAGIKGREYCKKNKENIICFVDNDKSKIGESINGVKIFCFDEVKEQLKNEHFHIAVSEEKQYVIMKQLYDAGITNYSANL